MHEKSKAESSFWFPYFQESPNDFTMLDWTEKQLSYITDLSILAEFSLLKQEFEKLWNDLIKIILKDRPIFGQSCLDKKIY